MSGSERAGSVTLGEERASLRRLAALVATGAASTEVFAAVAREVAVMLRPRLVQIYRWERDGSVTVAGTWGDGPNPFPPGSNWAWDDPSLVAMREHLRTGQPVRIEDVAESIAGEPVEAGLGVGVGSAAGAPIVVDGEAWGHIGVAMAKGEPLPDRVEERLAEITELVATAINSSTHREQLVRLADEQAALRRVATLVARGAPPADVFQAVAEELGRVLDVSSSGLVRYDDRDTARLVAGWGRLREVVSVGARLPLGGSNVVSEIARTGRPARMDDYGRTASGPIGERSQRVNIETSIGGPVVVAGRLWGAMIASTADGGSLPPDTERRLEQFVELVGTAIANTEARVELARLADEQAALRRVATLVAEEAPVAELFRRVGEEVAGVLGPRIESAILRYEADDTATVLAGTSEPVPGGIVVGERLPLDGSSVSARVYRERCAVRVDDYSAADGAIADHASQHEIRGALGCPILVKGLVWGCMVVAHREEAPFPADTEQRVSQFTELVATAIANAEARARVLTAGDDARRRVVRDLHDGAQQRLVHTIVALKLAQRALDDEDRERTRSLLAETLAQAEHSNAELRELAHGILPSVLTHGGLRAGVDSVVSRLDLPVGTDVTGSRLPPEIEASAYFIIAEALTNVVKHAQAATASVTAAVTDAILRLEVRDDGIGGADAGGHGLLGIGDRVAALGGRLHIDSPRGGGTVLVAELPVPA